MNSSKSQKLVVKYSPTKLKSVWPFVVFRPLEVWGLLIKNVTYIRSLRMLMNLTVLVPVILQPHYSFGN